MEERGLGNLLKERTQRMGIARRNWKQDIEATLGSEGGPKSSAKRRSKRGGGRKNLPALTKKTD